MTTSEAAAELGYSLRHIQTMLNAGAFPNAVKHGRDWWIPDADVAAVKARGRKRKRRV